MSSSPSLYLGLLLLLLFSSCQAGEIEGEVGPPRVVKQAVPDLSVSSADRFGFRRQPVAPKDPKEVGEVPRLFAFDLPAGWRELPGTQFRLINLEAPGDVQCWVSTARGSLLANLNRWRGQLGLSPWNQARIDALPRKPLLELPAVYIELAGDSKGGMGAKPIPGAKMLGLVAKLPSGISMFVKMIGPGAAVDRQKQGFDDLRQSLAPNTKELDGGSGAEKVSPAVPQTQAGDGAEGLAWQTPEGWSRTAPRPMRVATFRLAASPETECWISSWSGEVGGVMSNVTRWRGQVGLAPLRADQVADLPRIGVLGGQGLVVDAIPPGEGGQSLLAMLAYVDGESTFVKMIGPKSEVEAERANFMALCRSLRRSGR